MPDVIIRLLQIGSSLRDGMLVEAVETRLVDDIENSFLGVADSQRRVAGRGLAISLHGNHRTEVDALLGITRSMPCHRQLRGDGLHLMGHLSRQGDAVVQLFAFQSDGDEFVGMRGEIFSFDGFAIAHVPIFNDG